jgi:hypothetical protein
VLIVEREDRSFCAKGPWRLRARRLDEPRHRKLEVVRDVALSEAENCKTGLWQREYSAPHFERLFERARLGDPAAERRHLVVVDGVVSQIAAASQDHAGITAQLPRAPKACHHAVRKRAPSGRHHDFGNVREQACYVQLQDQRAQVPQKCVDGLKRARQALFVDDTLESLNPRQRKVGAIGDGSRHMERLLMRPAAGPPTRRPELHEDLEAAMDIGGLDSRLEEPHPRDGIDKAVEVEAWIGFQLLRHPARGGRLDQLVGQDHPVHSESPPDANLAHGRGGHRPGAIVELQLEKLWGHRSLAVRSEQHVVALAPGGHQLAVVAQG